MNLRSHPVLSPGSLERLQSYDWPGNVRELENIVERELIQSQNRHPNEPIRFDSIGLSLKKPKMASNVDLMAIGDESLDLESMERAHILRVLEATRRKGSG